MKFLRMTLITFILIGAIGCSRSGGVFIIYLNGEVKVNGIAANTGAVEGKEISINTGKNSSLIAMIGSKIVFALSEETNIIINKDFITLISGRIIASTDNETVIRSRELSVETGKSLLELISKSNVSVINNYTGELFVKSITSGSVTGGLVLNENFSIESVNGSFSPSRSLGTDVVRMNSSLKDLSVLDKTETEHIMNKISPECISLINSSYGKDIEMRYALKTLTSAHGALSEVITKKRKRIIGAVSVSGRMMTIYTVSGKTVIPVSDVKSMKQYNGAVK